MKKLFHSVVKRDPMFFWDQIIIRRLGRIAQKNNSRRKHKIAVFGNDYIGNEIIVRGVYEGDYLQVIFDFLSPLATVFHGGLALDVGANIGNHSIYFSDIFDQVFSYEPNPDTYTLLEFNTRKYSNVACFNIGLGEGGGVCSLVENRENVGGSYLSDQGEGGVDVNISAIDDLNIESKLCFIKMDVEGFEHRVLSGALAVLSKQSPVIVFEQHERDFVGGRSKCLELLSGLGYKFCWIQSGIQSDNLVFRRLSNILELFFGKEFKVLHDKTVPAGTYPMLIALPSKFHDLFGV